MDSLKISIGRFIFGLNRYSKSTNLRRLNKRGEAIDSITIREVTVEDMPNLVALHVKTWADTYWNVKKPPTFQIREYQWRQQFKIQDGSWFCYVAENKEGQLIGFIKGRRYNHADLPRYSGELHKIYLLREYQRMGLGKKLIGYAGRRFLSMGINSMVLFSEAQNPTGYFYEAVGGERLYSKAGKFNGGYGWNDLHQLAEM